MKKINFEHACRDVCMYVAIMQWKIIKATTPNYYRIAGKIGGTKFWRMSKNDCFGKYNFGVSALAAHILRPAFILGCQNLANNHPFAEFANFYSLQYFPLYGILTY